MDHPENDSLISAYLDGELNAAERAQIEQRLAADPQARQLLDELKSIRAGLQSLPKHQLPADFAGEVLRRAQQEKQVDPAQRQAAAWRPSMLRSWRGIGWSLAALAAAVIVMVATRQPDQANRQVAQAPVQPPVETPAIRSQAPASRLAKEESVQPQWTAAPHQKDLTANEPAPQAAAAGATAAAPPSGGETPIVGQINSEQAMFVIVDLSPQPQAKQEFEQILASNHVVVDLSERRTDAESNQTREMILSDALERVARNRNLAADKNSASVPAQTADRSRSADNLDVFGVETSQQQISSILKALGQSKSVQSLAISDSSQFNNFQNNTVPPSQSDQGGFVDSRPPAVPLARDWISRNAHKLRISVPERPQFPPQQTTVMFVLRSAGPVESPKSQSDAPTNAAENK